ncbi:DUF3073 family protein [Actinomadura harenae]|uniref:DUF3073 family protein n=1 Tax=Actinomadura harenae TaxID=2483351 RepID=A0A3M2MEB8_9ACTN|nr:DUF3073 family protein [Actinomadura harenae]RMI47243.1 DUF3073 family protein [Actinomadura harenae]
MGRGRAKAMQAKVARKLKYDHDMTDLERLRRELGATTGPAPRDDTEDRPERRPS